MASFTRLSLVLLSGSAAIALSACDGANGVASPGGGGIVINPTPAPSPTPTPTPSPTASPSAAFAETTQSGITITRDEQLAVVNAGTNNNLSGTNALTGILPTANSQSITAGSPTTLGAFFTAANYIGAINPAGDTWYQGWTCNSSTAALNGSGLCTALPTIAAANTPAATACPTGTTDGGTNTNYRLCRLPARVNADLSLPTITGVAYQMNGRVDVGTDVGGNGAAAGGTAATLTFAAGAIIVSNSSDAANDYMVVNRGSKLVAVGTPTSPIIFTSQQNLNSANNSDVSQGQWGGVILAGRAPISNCNVAGVTGGSAACENVVEGTGNALYGGNLPADSSGQLSYVQIRYSGTVISEGNELQALTTGGAGSGTILDHIQSHNSSDDGIEIFGGTVNLKYIVITGADDDGLDTDVGWIGGAQFVIAAQKVSGATSDSFSTEIDSNGNEDALPRQKYKLANFTFIQTATAPAAIRLRGGADARFMNGIVKAVGPCINMIAGTDANGGKSTIRPAGGTGSVPTTIEEDGPPVFTSVYFACNGA